VYNIQQYNVWPDYTGKGGEKARENIIEYIYIVGTHLEKMLDASDR
jgi:hypothetical protein